VPDEQGKEKFYCFTVIVYGYAPAVAVVTRMVRPIVSFAHKLGIRISIFVDDGLVAGESKLEAEDNTELVLDLFQQAGWNIQWKKTSTEAQQRVRYLGVEVDTESMEFRLPEDKLKDIEATLNREVGRGLRKEGSEKKEAAELLGKLAACKVTHGEVLHIMTRAAQHQLGMATQQENWEGKLLWNKDAVREFQKVRENLRYYNGRNVRQEETTNKKYTVQDTKQAREQARRSLNKRIGQELGENHSLIFTARKQCEQVTDWESNGCGRMEEGLDELQAVWTVLQRDKDKLQKLGGSRVFWETNSSNGYKLCRKGARQHEVQKWAELVRRVEKEQRITLVFVWAGPEGDKNPVNRGVGQSTDEWSEQEESLQPILDRFGIQLTVGGFATAYNTKCKKCFSKGPQEGLAGLNFSANT
jgi:hypothetical protein